MVSLILTVIVGFSLGLTPDIGVTRIRLRRRTGIDVSKDGSRSRAQD